MQNILGDLFGALAIVLDKPFVIGDAIAVDQIEGIVEHVGLKTTRIRSTSGEQVIVSNADPQLRRGNGFNHRGTEDTERAHASRRPRQTQFQ